MRSAAALLLILSLTSPAYAEDDAAVDEFTGSEGHEEAPPPPAPGQARKGGNYREQREAEGTKARNRFEVNTVTESPYKLNRQSLEVDPD
jgi:hypothetical protein